MSYIFQNNNHNGKKRRRTRATRQCVAPKHIKSINYIHRISFEIAERRLLIVLTAKMWSPCQKYCSLQLPFVALSRAHLPCHVFYIQSRKMSSKRNPNKVSRTHTVQHRYRVVLFQSSHHQLGHTNRPALKISDSILMAAF